MACTSIVLLSIGGYRARLTADSDFGLSMIYARCDSATSSRWPRVRGIVDCERKDARQPALLAGGYDAGEPIVLAQG